MDFGCLGALDDPLVDQFSSIATPHTFDEADGLAGALGGHRIVPAVFLVENIAQGIVVLLVARRRNVEAAPAYHLHARRHKMQLDAALMCVAHPKHIALVSFEARKARLSNASMTWRCWAWLGASSAVKAITPAR